MKSWSGSSVRRSKRRATHGSGRLGAHDDVALFERGAQGSHVVLGELVLVGERFELLLLDEAALGGLLDQALGRRQVMQVNRVAQLNPFLGRGGAARAAASSASGARECPRSCRIALCLIYRTACLGSPFPNIANLRFSNIP